MIWVLLLNVIKGVLVGIPFALGALLLPPKVASKLWERVPPKYHCWIGLHIVENSVCVVCKTTQHPYYM